MVEPVFGLEKMNSSSNENDCLRRTAKKIGIYEVLKKKLYPSLQGAPQKIMGVNIKVTK